MSSIFKYISSLFNTADKVESLDRLKGFKRVNAILNNLCLKQEVPGIAITLLKNGETILQNSYGYADFENKITIDPHQTIFRIASISKCITGLAFGKMVEDGILQWDDSFYKHVPYYPKKKYDFTLRQLASHTAGIRVYKGKEFALNKSYTIKESLSVFKDDPLVYKPGNEYLYNSFDFVLLSLAMQEASGIPFEKYVKDNVLEPLGMMNTCPPLKEDLVDRSFEVDNQAKFYTKTAIGFKKAIEVNNFYKLAGGGYLSTSEDIGKLGQAILEKKLLQIKTYRELLKAPVIEGNSTYYGLGFQVSEDEYGRPFVGHIGSSVGAYSNLFVYPEEDVVVSILVNCTDSNIQESLDEVVNTIIISSKTIT